MRKIGKGDESMERWIKRGDGSMGIAFMTQVRPWIKYQGSFVAVTQLTDSPVLSNMRVIVLGTTYRWVFLEDSRRTDIAMYQYSKMYNRRIKKVIAVYHVMTSHDINECTLITNTIVSFYYGNLARLPFISHKCSSTFSRSIKSIKMYQIQIILNKKKIISKY